MTKIITLFEYEYTDQFGNVRRGTGSFYGRKVLSVDAIRRRVRKAEERYRTTWMRSRKFRVLS